MSILIFIKIHSYNIVTTKYVTKHIETKVRDAHMYLRVRNDRLPKSCAGCKTI